MNSYVSVEEQDVPCEGLENLVFSTTNISECSIDSRRKDVEFLNIASKNLPSCSDSNALIPDDYLVCMTDDSVNENSAENYFGSGEKLDHNFGSVIQAKSKIEESDRPIPIDPKLIPVNVEDNYESCNAVDIEYLPFETVLMNYPGEVDYLDLHEKFLNIKFGNSPNPFESENETNSFDGFSDSNSSFEGFNETGHKTATVYQSSKESVKSKLNTKPKSKLPAVNPSELNEQRLRSRSTETDFKLKSNSNRSIRHSIDNSQNLGSEDRPKPFIKSVFKDSSTTNNSKVGPIFGDYKVTPLSSRAKANDIKAKRLNLPLYSSVPRPSFSHSRSVVGVIDETCKSFQNYSEGVASSLCSSATSKFKEKINEPTGAMHQKGKKEKIISLNLENVNSDMEAKKKTILEYKDLFAQDSEDESFEGFQSDSNLNVADIKNEDEGLEEFIGTNCDKIGCTISWLESKQAKNVPQNINNGIVFELSEFAKKIAWESEFVADWICRLVGFVNIKAADEDMRKINSVLKRRKALSVNFAGSSVLKTKLSLFDAEVFSLPSIEKINKNNSKEDCLDLSQSNTSQVQHNEINPKTPLKSKSNVIYKKRISDNVEKSSDSKNVVSVSYSNKEKAHSSELSSPDETVINTGITENAKDGKEDFSENDTNNFDHYDSPDFSSDLDLSDTEISDLSDTPDQNIKMDEINSSTTSKFSSIEHRVSGRIRKPTTKAQESYSLKYMSTPQSKESNEDINPTIYDNESEILKPKFLNHIFKDDGKEIGPNCNANSINVCLLNSMNEISYPITNGIVYELYHFFRERKASLTSLVHTLYRLKKIPFDKSHIIATMAKIHEMVKVMWKENVNKNPNMPHEEFNLLISENSECKSRSKRGTAMSNDESEVSSKNVESPKSEPLSKKRKISSSSESLHKELSSERSESDSNSESCNFDSLKENASANKSFDLNSTKGYLGKITRGDIVYLYTKWLKKKMEGQSNVFVTDLSRDVEELINERKIDCIRIPVGTLMSSSVKLFDEFRKLSRVNMLQAKMYLLEDWIEDIKSKLISNVKKKSISEQHKDNQENEKSSNLSTLNHSNARNKISKSSSIPVENMTSKENITKESDHTETFNENNCINSLEENKSKENDLKEPHHTDILKNLLSNVPDGYEVDKIVGYRIVKIGEESITEYRIRWLGFTSKDDAWINESDLNCPEILARFWEALNKQRALKGKMEPGSSNQPISTIKQSITNIIPVVKQPTLNIAPTEKQPTINIMPAVKQPSHITSPVKKLTTNNPSTIQQTSYVTEKKAPKTFIKGQENVSPFFGRENGSQNFFNIMINSLKPDLVDYQHEEETAFLKRVKVNKGDILQIYDEWRFENQEHLLTGGNQKVDVNVLIARVKELMERKKVRNFNASCIIDACYRMALMRAKLRDASKVKEYLTGDFIEFMQISQKHQDFVRSDYSSKLKKLKQNKTHVTSEYDKISTKINTINNLERESLIIAKYLDSNKNSKIEKEMEDKLPAMQKSLQVELKDKSLIENIKKQNAHIIKELETYGVTDNTMDELLNIAMNIKL